MAPRSFNGPTSRGARRGFTLIEVLVALVILSVMAGMCWKGLDGILKSREIADGSLKRSLRMQSVMQQWAADLNAVVDTGGVQALQFDGAALRLTRQATGGVQVVVWALRSGRWVRWAGPAVTSQGQIKDQWNRSLSFQGREQGTLAALKGVEQWQLYFFRGGAWTNAQSSAGVSAAARQAQAAAAAGGSGLGPNGQPVVQAAIASREPLPMGVRSVLTLGEGSGYRGSIVRDAVLAAQPGQQ